MTDRGVQFNADYLLWCAARSIKARFGAIGKTGSIALVERFIRSFKDEWLRVVMLPLRRDAMLAVAQRYVGWYNEHRPHQGIGGLTPNEKAAGAKALRERPRVEPRARYPVDAPNVARVRDLAVDVRYVDGAPQLPIVALKTAA